MKETTAPTHAWLRGGRAFQLLSYLLLTLAAGWVVFPFLWGVLGAFKPGHQILRIPPTLIADEWTLQNFRALTKVFPVARIYANSLFVSTAATAAQIITSAMPRHPSNYTVVQVQRSIYREPVAGQAPSPTEVDPDEPVISVLMQRNLGRFRLPGILVTIGSGLLFLASLLMLHTRDLEVRRRLEGEGAAP